MREDGAEELVWWEPFLLHDKKAAQFALGEFRQLNPEVKARNVLVMVEIREMTEAEDAEFRKREER